VPGFLYVISALTKRRSKVSERQQRLLELSQDAVDLLAVALKDAESKELIIAHSACNNLCEALKFLGKNPVAQEWLL
jgi:hypothetical protein